MQSTSSSSVKVFYPTLRREDVLSLLRQRIPELQERLPLKRVVLFGSYARDRHTVASDIDVLIIYGGPHREDAFKLVKGTLNIPRLEPHVYAEEEMEHMGSVIERMTCDGIPIELNVR